MIRAPLSTRAYSQSIPFTRLCRGCMRIRAFVGGAATGPRGQRWRCKECRQREAAT
jgi:hypothetical protein